MAKASKHGGRRCGSARKDGQACHKRTASGKKFCFAHEPASAKKRNISRRRGSSRKQVVATSTSRPELSPEIASEVLELLTTIEGARLRAELDPRVNAASYVRERWHEVAPEYRPRTTSFSTRDAWDPDWDIKRWLTDLQNFTFKSDLDHVVWAALHLARRRDALNREELETWWTSHRGGKGRDGNKQAELFLPFSTYDRARRLRPSARAAKARRRHHRPRN